MSNYETQAIILVGGQGTRLQPLTLKTPKPLLKIAGIPLIQYQIEKLRDAGIHRIVLATSFKADVFHDVLGNGSQFGIEIVYAHEESPLGTGGAMRNAANLLTNSNDSPVVIFNGDIISNINIYSLVEYWKNTSSDVSLYLTRVDNPKAFGLVPTDVDGRVQAFLEKPEREEDIITNQINAGCYIFKKSVLLSIPENTIVSVEKETFPKLLSQNIIMTGYVTDDYWLDMGTPQSFVKGSSDMIKGIIVSREGMHQDFLCLSTSIQNNVVIKDGAFVGKNVEIQDDTEIINSIIQDNARISNNCTIENSIIGEGVFIGRNAVIKNAIIGDGAWIGSDNELLNGVRIWNHAHIQPNTIRFSGK